MRLIRNTTIFALSFLILFPAPGITATLRVSWNANAETDLGGYLIYYGTQSGNYSACIDVGKVTSYQLTGVQNGTTCYVAVAAYDTSQNDSALSVEQRVTVPLSTSYTTVPNVVGMTQNNAKSTLIAAGLVTVFAGSSYSTTVPAGYIKSQYPAGGASVSPGTAVNLVISAGPEMKTVPNVVGMTQSTAQSSITSAGLSVGTISQANSTTVSAGRVISQSPASGTSVAIGTAVNFTVSLGPQPTCYTTVPNVTDAIWREGAVAESILKAFGFQVTKVYEYNITVLKGFAIRTNPVIGTKLPCNSTVTLFISLGPQP
jgi:beta-lactam-binding protein with PASTA domain